MYIYESPASAYNHTLCLRSCQLCRMLLISEYCFFFRLLFLCFRSWLPIKLFESSVELQRSGRIICFVCMFREGYIHTYFAIFLIITGTSERTHTHIYTYIHTNLLDLFHRDGRDPLMLPRLLRQ